MEHRHRLNPFHRGMCPIINLLYPSKISRLSFTKLLQLALDLTTLKVTEKNKFFLIQNVAAAV